MRIARPGGVLATTRRSQEIVRTATLALNDRYSRLIGAGQKQTHDTEVATAAAVAAAEAAQAAAALGQAAAEVGLAAAQTAQASAQAAVGPTEAARVALENATPVLDALATTAVHVRVPAILDGSWRPLEDLGAMAVTGDFGDDTCLMFLSLVVATGELFDCFFVPYPKINGEPHFFGARWVTLPADGDEREVSYVYQFAPGDDATISWGADYDCDTIAAPARCQHTVIRVGKP